MKIIVDTNKLFPIFTGDNNLILGIKKKGFSNFFEV